MTCAKLGTLCMLNSCCTVCFGRSNMENSIHYAGRLPMLMCQNWHIAAQGQKLAKALDVRTIHGAAARMARAHAMADWPQGWYRSLMGVCAPPPVAGLDHTAAVDVHQLRAGHWSALAQYLHLIRRNPSRDCPQCSGLDCWAGWCPTCHMEEADIPRHILCRCPALMGTRMRLLGCINPDLGGSEERWSGGGPGGCHQVPPEPISYTRLLARRSDINSSCAHRL